MAEDRRPEDEREPQSAGGDIEPILEGQDLASLYDFALRLTLDPSLALDTTLVALRRLCEEPSESRAPRAISTHLYALLREEGLARLRRGGRGELTNGNGGLLSPLERRFITLPAAGPSLADEAARWVWQSARGQRPRDYALLDLSLRRGLTPEDVADVAGLSQSGIYATLGRLRGLLEEAFAAWVLHAYGRDDCAGLAAAAPAAAEMTPALRRHISSHVEECAVCRATRARYPLAGDVFAAFVNIEPPPELQAQIAALTAPVASAEETAPADDDVLPVVAPDALIEAVAEAPAAEAGADETAPLEPEHESSEAALVEAVATNAPVEEPDAVELPAETVASDALEASEQTTAPNEPAAPEGVVEPEEVVPTAAAPDARVAAPRIEAPALIAPAAVPVDPFRLPKRDLRRAPSRRRGLAAILDNDAFRRLGPLVLFVGLTALAIYLGWVSGTSIEGGSGRSGPVPPLSSDSAGARQIGCGSPISLAQGEARRLTFNASSLAGYSITNVNVRAVSPGASAPAIDARVQEGLTVAFEALPLPGQPNRTDEYLFSILFRRGNDQSVAECTVLVRAPAR
jgi:DNA-directed RNA polymerase specialized sigma24 family protein